MAISIGSVYPREGRHALGDPPPTRRGDNSSFERLLTQDPAGRGASRARGQSTPSTGPGQGAASRISAGDAGSWPKNGTPEAAWARSNPQVAAPSVPDGAAVPEQEAFVLPMQHVYQGPEQPEAAAQAEFPLHPVYGVPMVSQATLDRYIHPLQAVGVTEPVTSNTGGGGGYLATTVYRVAPEGMQDFVTSDGYRHRFDVEVVFPEPGSNTWNGGDATKIQPEVGEFAVAALRENLETAGLRKDELQMQPFRMFGGVPHQPWFIDQIRLTHPSGESLLVSLNVAMRDPRATVESVSEFLGKVES